MTQHLFILHRLMRSLRSSPSQRLSRANYNLMTYGAKAFAVSAPAELWNHLPIDITSCHNLEMFESKLMTLLYAKILAT